MKRQHVLIPAISLAAALYGHTVDAAPISVMSQNLQLSVPMANMNLQMNSVGFDAIKGQLHSPTGANPRQEDRAALEKALQALTFKPSAEVSERVRRKVVDDVARNRGADTARQLEAALAERDVVGEFHRLLTRYGFSGTNLGDVMAAFYVMSWEVVFGRDATSAQIKGADGQIRRALASGNAVRQMSDADKQSVAESLIYQTTFSSAAKNRLVKQRDTTQLAKLRDSTRAAVRQFGIDFDTVRLTENGFERDR